MFIEAREYWYEQEWLVNFKVLRLFVLEIWAYFDINALFKHSLALKQVIKTENKDISILSLLLLFLEATHFHVSFLHTVVIKFNKGAKKVWKNKAINEKIRHGHDARNWCEWQIYLLLILFFLKIFCMLILLFVIAHQLASQ